jgi:monoamine oxidase
MVQLALDSLAEMFGTGVRRHLSASATTAWGTDPRIRGGYTVCRPGHADARLRLTQPVEERIFLAGEACAPEAFGTVGGAHASGVAAARRAVAVAGGQAPSGAPAG